MKRFKLIQALAMGLALVGFSCTKLDENLKDTWTDKNFLKNPAEINAALVAPYGTLYSYGQDGGFLRLSEITTDELMIPQRGGDWYDGGQPVGLHIHTWEPKYDAMGVWNQFYLGVSACNRLLATPPIPTVPAYVAELKVLRAYFYFVLMDFFGNVPIVTTLGEAKPQSTPAQVYAFVESEITTNMDALPKKNDNSVYGRLTYYGAQAILAKMYLNAAVYKGSAEWQKCYDACDVIIKSGIFNLEPKYSSAFAQDNAGSPEHIWAIPYDHLYGQGLNIDQMTLHYSSQLTYTMQEQPWNGYCSLEEFYNSYDALDDRKANNFLVGPQYLPDGVTAITDDSYEKVSPNPGDPNAIPDPDGAPVNFTPAVNELFPNALRQSGARIGKFNFYQGMTRNMDNDWPLYRYGDILLTQAEALFNLNGYSDAEGLGLVNQVHQRAGLLPYASMTADELLAERGREMFMEAWRRNDLIRFGKFGGTWFGKTDPDNADGHLNLFPIPSSQILATSGTETALVQNPGY